MDIDTRLNNHALKEPNTMQSTPLYKLFPDTSPFLGVHNVLYKSPKNKLVNKTATPQSRPQVKRNLSNSFNETPKSDKNSPHLNYSVISENETDASLVLKLRLSKTQPYVNLTQTNELLDNLFSLPEPGQFSRTIKKTRRISFADENSIAQIGSPRRSSRAIGRKSYAELLSPEKLPDDFLGDKSIKSPTKRLRAKSVDSNYYNDANESKTPDKAKTSSFHSPNKRSLRPRGSAVALQSYKDDYQDFESDGLFSSPTKRIRSKRNIRLPIRYQDLSDYDDGIIDGVQELVISDDEDVIIISSFSPKKKLKSSLSNTCSNKGEQDDVLDINEDKANLQRSECSKNNFFADRWRSLRKTPRLSTTRTSLIPNDLSPENIQNFNSAPVDRWRLKDHSPPTPRTSKKTPSKLHSPIKHDTPSKSNSQKASTPNPKTPSRSEKTSSKLSTAANITPKSQSNQTPQRIATNSLKLMRAGLLTPTVQCRLTAVKGPSTPLNKARLALHVAHVPDALPCREKESGDIHGFVQGKLLDGCGGCMYISGVPGTGKTATISYVIRQLQKQCQSGELPKFDYVSVNGMRLTEPRQSYVEILKQLTGKTVPWEQAQNQLNSKFTKKGQKASKPIVLLIDELDILCTKRQDVVYNLLDWPSKAYCQLIVVTIANTMDLPERLLMGRVTSRLGLTRLTFQAYNHKQLQEIVTKRLYDSKTFNPDAIQLVARKVASVSGDARRALDICRRAAEMAEADGKNARTLVSMTHVNEALDSMMTQPKIRAIKCSSRLQKLLLQSIVAEIERTGVEETTFSAVFRIFSSVAAIDGFAMVSMTLAMTAIARLGSCRLLLLDQKISGLYQRIMLNVSVDDVYYALKSE